MFDFLRRSGKGIEDFSLLGTDMHAHWLPGIDDGAKTIDDSLQLIRGLVDMGYRELIATPHVMADFYPNTPATINGALAEVRRAVTTAGIDVRLTAAAEYLLDEGFMQKLRAGELLTLPGNHVLVEFSFVAAPKDRDAIFFELLTKGYHPILAHPERYAYYHRHFDEYRAIAQRGVKLQVNLLSLVGHYGKEEKKVAEKLIDARLVSILGTDAHHARHLKGLRALLGGSKYGRIIGAASWENDNLFGQTALNTNE